MVLHHHLSRVCSLECPPITLKLQMLSTKQISFPSSPFYYRLHHFHLTQKVPEQSSGELNTVSFRPWINHIPVLNKEWGVQEVRVRRKGNDDKDFSPLSDLLGLPCSDCPASLNTCLHVRIFHTWWISHRSWSQKLQRLPYIRALNQGEPVFWLKHLGGIRFFSWGGRLLAWQVLGSRMVRDKSWVWLCYCRIRFSFTSPETPGTNIYWYSFLWLN